MPDMNENSETQQEYFGKTKVVVGMTIQEDVLKLRIENEQLKAQIEKMKCCNNCKHHGDTKISSIGYYFVCGEGGKICENWKLKE